MRTIPLVLSALLVLGLAGSADAGANSWTLAEWLNGPSAWKGHGVGSYYVQKATTERPGMPKMPDMPNIPGMPKGGKTTTTTKHTLTQITDTEYVIKVETTSMGRTFASEQREPRKRHSKAKVTRKGEGSVTVEGQAYPCTIHHISDFADLIAGSLPPGKPGERKMQMPSGPGDVWEHPKLGVLQTVATMTMMGRSNTMTWKVTKLSVSRTVGGHTFNCREMSTSNTMMPGGKNVMQTSRDFPGGSLYHITEMKMMGFASKTTTEVTEYVKKPAAVVTGK